LIEPANDANRTLEHMLNSEDQARLPYPQIVSVRAGWVSFISAAATKDLIIDQLPS
jgi:hypothetical protein